MTTTDPATLSRYLDLFPAWLRSLGEDAAALGGVVGGEASEETRRHVTTGLNYIFKSLDLIPDGIDDLGFCDDAFVIRVASALAVEADASAAEGEGPVGRLAKEAAAVSDFLGDDYVRLVDYVKGLPKGAVRGRTVDDIVADPDVRSAFVHEVGAWAAEYQVPSFTRDLKTLIKLKAFLSAKLA
jgi:uncharacterized membrane protein YkvA (DUF1232 family)